tara:strand:+ start:29 stop:484 length:456 start_codon:yes stop_codon:yes gene_type:complete
MNRQEQMLKILKDTRDYYAEDPDGRRSIDDDGSCNYTWGENHCAVGRYLKPEFQRETWSSNGDSVNQLCEEYGDVHGEWNIDWVLREEVHGLDADFWRDLQDFHDCRHNWICKDTFFPPDTENEPPVGLSDTGKGHYVGMQDRIAEGRYDG